MSLNKSFSLGKTLVLLLGAGFLWIVFTAEQDIPTTPEEIRTANILEQFNPITGSHRNLENLIKSSLQNPDSYNLIETTYLDLGDRIRVRIAYSAENGFGATIRSEATAFAAIDGKLSQVEI